MEKNTVSLSLEEYNRLRDFYENIKAGYVCMIYNSATSYRSSYECVKFMNPNLAVETISQINDKLAKDGADYLVKISTYERLRQNVKDKEAEIKKKSLWELIKWKYSK